MLANNLLVRFSFRALTVLLLLAAVLVSGCVRPTDGSAPDLVHAPESFSASGEQALADRWWTEFHDPDLNAVVQQALEQNFDLKTAWQLLEEAKALAESQSASLFPQVEAFSEAEASRAAAGTSDEVLRLGLSAEYEVDLWGRIRSETNAARLRAEAGREAYRTAAVSLSAEVVRTWYQLAAACARLRLLQDQINANEKILSLIKSRFENGQSDRADVIRQDQLLESTREQAHAAKSAISVFNHQLAVLLGRSFDKKTGCHSSRLPGLPPIPETGVPSQLLSRRPDVREARRRLQAADKDLAAAQISRYPRLSITASASTTDQDPSELFSDWLRSVAANLVLPVVDAGRLRAEADAAEAVKYQRLYEYGQIVAEAFQEVEDALVQEKKQKDRVRSLRRQLDLAQKAGRQLTDRYFNGAGNYIDVLSALTDEQQIRRDLLGARLQLLEYRIALYRALAGGFETRQEEN